ncbi:MAG: hypothetical protein U0793_26495 [Gemmataceae bacterium]
MADESVPINNLLATAKSREVQRGSLAEMRGERANAALHFLAAGHMELVLAADYEAAGEGDLALRSRLSAGSCLWRAGEQARARSLFDNLLRSNPDQSPEIQRIVSELAQDYPLAS